MSGKPDPSPKLPPAEPHWPEIRAWLQTNPQTLLDDRSLLEEIGLKPHGRNVVEFGRAALTKLEEAAEREADARKRIESIARANFAAQTQTRRTRTPASVLVEIGRRDHPGNNLPVG